MLFKNTIPMLRAEKGITQQQLADAVDVRRETIGRIENGLYNPSLKLAADIAHYFSRRIDEVFIFEYKK